MTITTEAANIRNRKPLFVDVIITERNNPNTIVQRHKVNYDRIRSREWMGNLCGWALRSGYAVHTAAMECGE